MRDAVGRKYKFDPMYLLSSQPKKENTFFCSELVAAALQNSGLMAKSSPAHQFLPSTSSINRTLLN